MIESTDYLLNKHFGKFLEDKGVEILDPATCTGTFICDIIDYIRKDKLEYKYKNELHANEIAILPYYISNLNIEFTYKQKTGQYAEFQNLCFMDTLDNLGFKYRGKQFSIFEQFTEENSKRIYKQNTRSISVVIGNPPYNANQANENDNNKNREYPKIDKRIKDTFIKNSTAQKTKVYDMYARFYRWSFDRLDENGIVAFVTNRSFIDSRTFDGFRKSVQQEFDYAYIIDTKSDVRTNPKIAGTTHNVFGIQTGVAIMLLVKKLQPDIKLKREKTNCEIYYFTLEDFWKKEEKLQWFTENPLQHIPFDHILPDKNNNWINIADNDFGSFIPLCSKDVKSGKSNKALFELLSLGVVTNRDDWCYDFKKETLRNKVSFFCDFYEKEKIRWENSGKKIPLNDFVDRTIKWTEELETHLKRNSILNFDENKIRQSNYRPFTKKFTYADKIISHRLYQNQNIWGINDHFLNKVLILTIHPQVDLSFFCSKILVDQGFGSRASTILPFYRYDINGNQFDNMTDWGLNQFTKKYGKKGISKEAIFHYVYAVLHYPAYQKKYELNLKREFPRIPFYSDFNQWSAWGKAIMDLHLNYEEVTPYPLEITIETYERIYTGKIPKAILKADKVNGKITLDTFAKKTILSGLPPEVWEYKLGNRSALEWVLDQYKEKTPTDPTIAEKFNTYKFADYEEYVIDLLKKVCTVSVETMAIITDMKE